MTPTRVEARVLDLVRRRVSPPPRTSGALSRAARELAARAAAGDPDPAARGHLRGALARALAGDPAPAVILGVAPPDEAAEAVTRALPRGATHAGAGAVERDGRAWVVVLLSERRAAIDPFPRDVPTGARPVLSGTLAAHAEGARVFVTRPSGKVVDLGGGPGRAFRVPVDFPEPGRHVVEVVAQDAGSPEVAALLTVAVGAGASLDPPARPALPPEPADRAAAERAVLEAMNAFRRASGLGPLAPSPQLSEVARRHSEAMAATQRVAHVVPGSGQVRDRVARAGVAIRRVYENVARDGTSLGAHVGLEESPAHRANLLAPGATLAGVGIARTRLPSGEASVYLTEVLLEPPDDGAESRLTHEGRVRQALWRERERAGLPALTQDPALEGLAREAAHGLRARDDTDPGGTADHALALRRKLAAVDVFVASAPDEATRSANVGDARFRRVGVGVAAGDSARFGKGRLWIVVVYSD